MNNDFLGNHVDVGSYIVYPSPYGTARGLRFGVVKKIGEKQLSVSRIDKDGKLDRLYPQDVLVIDEKVALLTTIRGFQE